MERFSDKQNGSGDPRKNQVQDFEYDSAFGELMNSVTPFMELDPTKKDQLIKSIDIASKANFYKDIGSVNKVSLVRGATNAQIETYFDGMIIEFIPSFNNTGETTLKINGLSEKQLKLQGETLSANSLIAGKLYKAVYNSSDDYFELYISSNLNNIADVATVEDLVGIDTNVALTAIVRDKNRGGVFIYDATKSNINDGGTIYSGWVRQYNEEIYASWFGCINVETDDMTTDSIIELNNARDVAIEANKTLVIDGLYNISSTFYLDNKINITTKGQYNSFIYDSRNISSGAIRAIGESNFEDGVVSTENLATAQSDSSGVAITGLSIVGSDSCNKVILNAKGLGNKLEDIVVTNGKNAIGILYARGWRGTNRHISVSNCAVGIASIDDSNNNPPLATNGVSLFEISVESCKVGIIIKSPNAGSLSNNIFGGTLESIGVNTDDFNIPSTIKLSQEIFDVSGKTIDDITAGYILDGGAQLTINGVYHEAIKDAISIQKGGTYSVLTFSASHLDYKLGNTLGKIHAEHGVLNLVNNHFYADGMTGDNIRITGWLRNVIIGNSFVGLPAGIDPITYSSGGDKNNPVKTQIILIDELHQISTTKIKAKSVDVEGVVRLGKTGEGILNIYRNTNNEFNLVITNSKGEEINRMVYTNDKVFYTKRPYVSMFGYVATLSSPNTFLNSEFKLPNIPASDPADAGALWNDNGILKISAG